MQEVPMKPVCRNDRTGLGAQNRRGKDRPLEQNVRDGIHCAASAAGGAGVQPGMYTAYRIGEFAGAGMKMKQKNGVWLLVTAAVLCSIGGVCIRGIPWTPLSINGARNAIAACVTAVSLVRRRHRLRWNSAVACGALSLALTTNLYVFSTKLAGAANAILLMYTAPIFVLLYLWLAKGQRPPRAAVAACALVFAGIGCFVADGLAAGTLLGNALGLASGVSYAGVFLVNTEPDGDAQSAYFFGQLAGALLGLPFLLFETDFSPVPVACVLALGVFQLGLSYVLMAKGLASTPPVTASLVTAIEPLLTPVWVMLAWGEGLSGFALAGAALVLCSVVWYNTHGAAKDAV